MRIAVLSTPHITTPPRGYGASELIAGLLAEDFARAGHQITLFATADSRPPGVTVCHFPRASEGDTFAQREFLHASAALAADGEFDVIHNHCLTGGPAALAVASSPAVTTLHYVSTAVREHPSLDYVAVSHRQAALLADLRVVAVIHHGIDLEAHPYNPTKDDYLLFLGRFHPNKGPHLAIKVAQQLGARLVIAAPNPPPDQQAYFEAAIRPHLKGPIDWIGSVEAEEKAHVLGHARCLLAPICWEEPFGLVYAEALACGTPVVSFHRGAAPEVICDGVTGYLVRDVVGMRDAVERIATLRPIDCRRAAEARFDRHRMAEDYLRLYEARLLAA